MIVHGISQWVIRSLATVSDPRQLAWDTCHEELAGYTLQRATTAERESSTADCDSSGRPCLWSNTYKCARLHWLRFGVRAAKMMAITRYHPTVLCDVGVCRTPSKWIVPQRQSSEREHAIFALCVFCGTRRMEAHIQMRKSDNEA